MLLFWLGMAPAAAVEVLDPHGDVRWGFDGTVVPERINLLSVRLTNTSEKDYEGEVTLYKTRGLAERIGGRLTQPCFLARFTSRWVQFHPYVGSEGEQWILKVGRKVEDLTSPALEAPATVWLDGGDPGRPAGLKSFPEKLFPTTVAATDALSGIVLDHVPRWEPVKRQAFLDWLRRGGTVHLLRGDSGRHPVFTAELSVLNAPGPRFRVGAGLVVRHEETRRAMNTTLLSARGFPPQQLEEGEQFYHLKFEDTVFRRLQGLVRPQHSWALIYAVLLAYMVLVGPLNYLVGRKTRDFRLAGLVFLVGVLGFAGLLSFIGRRGQGERAVLHALSYARPLEGGTCDVTQWVNAFAVRGAHYTITHPATHNLYSTCQDDESVNATIRNGRGGAFKVDIPLYSSRCFLHRGRMKGHDLGVRVLTWKGKERLSELTLAVGPDFPQEIIEAWALHGETFHVMSLRDGRLEMDGRRGLKLQRFLASERLGMEVRYPAVTPWEDADKQKDAGKVFQGMVRPLIARAIGGTPDMRFCVPRASFPDNQVQLFVFAQSPEGFRQAGELRGRELGCVLYHLDLFRPEEPDGSGD